MRGLLTAPVSEMKIYVENICKYILLAPNIRLEPLMYACLLLHVTTQNPLNSFCIDSFRIPFCIFKNYLFQKSKVIFLEFFHVVAFN